MERKISLLVPLSRFKVKYEVKVGRPCSELDELVLRAIAEGSSSMSKLEDKFRLPSRLMIEILVTLFTEGWISIIRERSGGFALTRQGQAILNSDKLLEIRRGWVREGAVMMERLTGALIAQKDIVFDSEPQLKRDHHWEKAFRLQATFSENQIDEGQVQYFLRRGKREWIRNISPPVLVSSYYWWLPVDVELEREAVTGLPERWVFGLKPLLLEEAAKILGARTDITFSSYWGDGSSLPRSRGETGPVDEVWPTSISRSDILSKRSEHIDCLRQVLVTARTTLLIASTFIDIHSLGAEVRGWMLETLRRGVEIDILWGDTQEQDARARGETIEWLQGIADEAKESNAQGGLRFNKEPGNSNLRLLVYDFEEAIDGSQLPAAPPDTLPQRPAYCAFIGSFNWLGESMKAGGEPAEHFTVRIGQRELIGRLSRSIGAIMNAQRGDHFSLTADRWNNIAEELQSEMIDVPSEAQTASEAENNPRQCTVRLVRDYEHQALLKSSLLSAQVRCAVFSSKVGSAALARLAPLKQRKQTTGPLILTVRYGELRDMTAEQQTSFKQLIDDASGQLTRQDGLQANALLADQTVLVSSYQFLAESPFAKARHTKAVGILIEGGIAAETLAEEYGLQAQQK